MKKKECTKLEQDHAKNVLTSGSELPNLGIEQPEDGKTALFGISGKKVIPKKRKESTEYS